MLPTLLLAALLTRALPPMQDPAPDPARPGLNKRRVAAPPDDGIETLVVTPGLEPQERTEAPYTIYVVDEQRVRERAYRTTPEALGDVPGVLVQQTGHGQGSPYLRGFTGYSNLLLIDGVRLNNSVFRSGPNQYWNTLDTFTVERFEVQKGPASVLYGSDAVGATLQAMTRGPYAWDEADGVAGALEWRGATAENYQMGRAEVSGAAGRLGALLGVTLKDFGDLEGGSDVGRQPGTGYTEHDYDAKLEYRLDDGSRVEFAHQRVDQNDVPRTHSTVDGIDWMGLNSGSDQKRDLDQNRELTYLQYHAVDLGDLADSAHFNVSWHEQREKRDRIRSNGRQEFQGFDVGTLGLFGHLFTETGLGRVAWGVDYYHDSIDSFLDRGASQTPADDIQGPVADDSTYETLSVFVQDTYAVNERLDVIAGARYERAAVDARSVRDPDTDERFSIEDDWETVVGSLRFGYDLDAADRWRLFGGASQGFRAPGLSDLTRFDSARSNEFEVPAADLEPEYYTAFELGVKGGDEQRSGELAVFYTLIDDMIVRVPTGETNGAGEAEVTKANVGDGYVWGFELGGAYRVAPAWQVLADVAWLEGRADTFATSSPTVTREYMDRLQPLTYHAGVRYEEPEGSVWSELRLTRAEAADRLSPRDAADDQRIPPGGTPAYTTLDLRGGWRASSSLTLTAGVLNLLDEDFRVHGSGVNGAGRNFVLGLRWAF